LVLIFLFWGCDAKKEADARESFAKEHPTFQITEIFTGEGDSSSAEVHIRYKKPGDNKIHEDVWQYLKSGDEWSVNYKETLGQAEPIPQR
jgi:hypothetical protein